MKQKLQLKNGFSLLKKLSKGTLLLCSTCLGFAMKSQAQVPWNYSWSKAIGGSTSTSLAETVSCIVTDADGNVYSVGNFAGTITLGSSTLTSVGNLDMFIFKTAPDGTVLWAKSFGNTGSDAITSIALGSDNNLYVSGQYSISISLPTETTPINLTSLGGNDVVIGKVDAVSGNFIWAKNIGSSAAETSKAITIDAVGDVVYVMTSACTGAVFTEFNPGGTPSALLNGPSSNTQIYVSKLAADGTFIWARGYGGTGNETPNAIATDASKNIIIGGGASGTNATFDTVTVASFSSGATIYNAFVCKLTPSGAALWVRQAGGSSQDYVNSLTTDADGNIYVAGYTNYNTAAIPSVLDFAGNQVTTLTPNPTGFNDEAVVAKLDVGGTQQWYKTFGNTTADQATAIAFDGNNQLHLGCHVSDTVTFNAGQPTQFAFKSAGSTDAVLFKMTTAGDFVSGAIFGGTSLDVISRVAFGPQGAVYISGQFRGTTDFNPGTGAADTATQTGTSGTSAYDGYLLKWVVPSTSTPITLASFNARYSDSKTLLNWITYSEKNAKGFEIERSSDGRTWKSIGYVVTKAEGGNSTLKLNYDFTDNAPLYGVNYYRLKNVDADGSFALSDIKSIFRNSPNQSAFIYPNPATTMLNVKFLANESDARYVITDMMGRTLQTGNIAASNIHSIDIAGLTNGSYYLRLIAEGSSSTFKFIKK